MERAIKEMEAAEDLSELAYVVAHSIRAVTGFERVMVYRFEFDGDGEVVGESLVEDWDQSFMGLRFPASDIPPQARALYRVSHERWIPARDYEPVPLFLSTNRMGEPFDLSLSLYRSISPVHQAYQQNIGADGAMSLSILCDGVLWGLVIGHHRQPHRLSAASRHQAGAIVRAFNIMLGGRLNRSTKTKLQSGLPSNSGILSRLAVAEECLIALTEDEPSIVDLLPGCVGAAVVWNDKDESRVRTAGYAPPPDDIVALTSWIRSAAKEPVFHCDCISELFPPFASHREKASGVLAVFFEDIRRPVLLLFRPEAIRSVSWAGKPEKLAAPNGSLSLPRRSFELWIEAKRNHSEAWTPDELEIAADLLATVNYVLVHEARRRRLKEAEQAALEASRAKSDFLANMSHELRTPMHAILGYSEISLGSLAEGNTEAIGGYIKKIQRSGKRLLGLLNNLLDLAKMEAGRTEYTLEHADLKGSWSLALAELDPLVREKSLKVRLSLKEHSLAVFDKARITQVLVNLLSNAIKFSKAGDAIAVEVSERPTRRRRADRSMQGH